MTAPREWALILEKILELLLMTSTLEGRDREPAERFGALEKGVKVWKRCLGEPESNLDWGKLVGLCSITDPPEFCDYI